MSGLLAVVATLIALPGAAAALHLGLLAAASLAYREPRPASPVPTLRFVVLIPAHNEEVVLAATLDAIQRDRRPNDEVVVVADRCTDRTAEIARQHGALVVERGLEEPPGRAAARQAGIAFALGRDWDAMMMIDADSLIEPGFFLACERMLSTTSSSVRRHRAGGEDGMPLALQARSEAALGRGLLDHAALASFAIQGLTMPRGRDRLGLLVRMRGTGMVLRREVVERFRFHAPASEDLWYSMDLCLAGILPRHVESARLRSANVRSWRAASSQRMRYEAGRMSAKREYLSRLLRQRDLASLEAAWWLATPPFAVAAGSLAAGAALAALVGAGALAWSMLALLALLGLVLAVALLQARAGLTTWLALIAAPWYIAWKLMVQARAMASVRRGETTYGPTAR